MICSLFNFSPQSVQSRGHWGALVLSYYVKRNICERSTCLGLLA